MNRKWNILLPLAIMGVFALSQWPGLMPLNFSAAYGLAFCAGVYFPTPWRFILPGVTLVLSGMLLNLHYGFPLLDLYLAAKVAVLLGITWLGGRFRAGTSWIKLVGGGMLGAIWFYLASNSLSWLFDPAYAKTLAGWIQALTVGRPEYPSTWEFFRNTLTSGGLFSGLFAAAMKAGDLLDSREPVPSADEEPESPEGKPEESQA